MSWKRSKIKYVDFINFVYVFLFDRLKIQIVCILIEKLIAMN